MRLETILPFFAKVIENELGIVYAEHNYFQLQNRLEEIAKFLNISDIEKLFEEAQKGITGQFKQMLLDVATNNETSFYRDPKIFKAIESTVIPTFIEAHGPTEKFNIWSAASSSGQEALSTAMLLKEWNKKSERKLIFSILGTDISERVLARAKLAQYTQLEVQRGLPAPMMIKYFTKDQNDKWQASTDLTNHIEYKKVNLKESFSFTQKFNLILCRNVLIYQSISGKIEILNRILNVLEPGGFLILGSGESLLGLSNDYDQIAADGAVIYRKKVSAFGQKAG